MRALFIHPTFPGPFRHMASRLAALPDSRVLFLAERGRGVRVAGVRRMALPAVPAAELACLPKEDDAQREMRLAMRRAAMTGNILQRLRRNGFTPDIICASASGGFSMYVQDIFPEAFVLGYADWYHTHGGNHVFFTRGRPRPPADFAPARVRNMLRDNLLGGCHALMTSSLWQQAQFPAGIAQRTAVLPDGVDTAFFAPAPEARFAVPECDLSNAAEIVSFCGRTGEPFRGFPQFARALPHLLELRPACHVVIMASGADKEALAKLRAELEVTCGGAAARVHVLGFCPPAEYRLLLQATTVHVYLTAPFTLSAGLFEALSCGCLLLGSHTEPVCEVVRQGENGFLCDFWDAEGMAGQLASLLERAPALAQVRRNARHSMQEQYDARRQALRQVRWLQESFQAFRQKA